MKKQLLIVFTLFSVVCVLAQNKPTKGTSGLGINYRLSSNVNIPVFKYDYYLTDSWVISAFYKPGYRASTSNALNSFNNNTTRKSTSFRYSQSLGVAIEKHFFDNLKIDPFVGFYLSHGFSSRDKRKESNENINDIGYTYYDETTTVAPSVNSISPALNIGLNYFILKNLSLGVQLDLGNSLSFVNGDETRNYIQKVTDSSGTIIQDFDTTDTYKIKSFSSNLFYSVNVKAAFYFASKNKEKKNSL